MQSLTQKQTQSVGSSLLAGQFMDLFENKIKLIREEMYPCRASCPPHLVGQDGVLTHKMGNNEATFLEFKTIPLVELR